MTPNAGVTNGWTAELERLRAENARLRKERHDALQMEHKTFMDAAQINVRADVIEARATAAEAKVAALEAERNKLRDAVKAHRFAQYGDGYPREGDQQADRNLYAALGAKP